MEAFAQKLEEAAGTTGKYYVHDAVSFSGGQSPLSGKGDCPQPLLVRALPEASLFSIVGTVPDGAGPDWPNDGVNHGNICAELTAMPNAGCCWFST